jgi:glucose-1-phosphate thymidylyltransferase
MKVIIPVAGIGSKLRPHTHTQPKALVPVAGKPILSHIVDNLLAAGMKEFIFIVGYLGEKVESYIRNRYPEVDARFLVQEPRLGTGHAVWMAKGLIGNQDQLLIALGDTIFDVELKDLLALPHSTLGVKRVDDPRQFGVAEIGPDGFITHVVEKPSIPRSNLALVGLYLIKEGGQLMDSLESLFEDHRPEGQEYHLAEAIDKMLQQGARISTFPVENWYDCGNKDSLLETNTLLLQKPDQNGPPARFPDTIIIPPVSIAPGCDIRHSIIGPNVSIGENTRVQRSILSDVIVGSYSQLENAVLHHSVIGSDASLKGLSQSLNLGDDTQMDYGNVK